MKLEFSRRILEKNIQISNFMKIRPVVAELFHADGQTDMTKLTVAYCNFAKAPAMYKLNVIFFLLFVFFDMVLSTLI
jgi:hypothetical protein